MELPDSAPLETQRGFDGLLDGLPLHSKITDEFLGRIDQASYALSKRSYWERLWIVPEVLLADGVMLYCGTKSMVWPALHAAAHLLDRLPYIGGF